MKNKIVAIILSAAMIVGCSRVEQPLEFSGQVEIVLDAPEIEAGQEIEAQLVSDIPCTDFNLIFSTVLSHSSIRIQEDCKFAIGTHSTRNSGRAQILVYHRDTLVEKKKLQISAQESSDKILMHYGPKSARVSETERLQLLYAPIDEYGNPIDHSTPMNFVQHQNSRQSAYQSINILDEAELIGVQKAGPLQMGVTTDDVAGPKGEFEIVNDPIESFSISTQRTVALADGRSFLKIISSPLTDKFGNSVSDGTIATIMARDELGHKISTQAQCIDGRFVGLLRHPSKSSQWEIQAQLERVSSSNRLELNFESALSQMEIHCTAYGLSITKARNQQGLVAPDGMMLTVKIIDTESTEKKYDAQIINGQSDIFIPEQILKNSRHILVEAGDFTKQLKYTECR